MHDWMASLRQAFDSVRFIDDPGQLADYSLDQWPVALKMRQQGNFPFRPEVIFRPQLETEVPRLLAWANQAGVAVTAWGAGSGVVGAAISHHHGIGLARQSYLTQELGASFVLLERLKDALDPHGILNPGKFGFNMKEG